MQDIIDSTTELVSNNVSVLRELVNSLQVDSALSDIGFQKINETLECFSNPFINLESECKRFKALSMELNQSLLFVAGKAK